MTLREATGLKEYAWSNGWNASFVDTGLRNGWLVRIQGIESPGHFRW